MASGHVRYNRRPRYGASPDEKGGSLVLWLLGGLAGIVTAIWYFNDSTPSDEAAMAAPQDPTPLDQLLATGKLVRNPGAVAHRERANGVDIRLIQFLDAWAASGPFRLVVAPEGGLRTDPAEQARLYSIHASNAPTLAETPHGRGGAIDVCPYTRTAMGGTLWEPNYSFPAAFEAIGSFAEAHGLRWGGHFQTLKGGDGPHVEVPDWESLPYPPADPMVLV